MCRGKALSFPFLTQLNFCYFSGFMASPEELAREKIDNLLSECGWHLQSGQLDRVSRVCISTVQRLYSMLRFLLFLFGLKHRCHRANSHEETGMPLCEFILPTTTRLLK
jgi:hypothetical protein